MIEDILDQYMGCLEAGDFPVVRLLNPGIELKEVEIDRTLSKYWDRLTPTIQTFYLWKNGTRLDDTVRFHDALFCPYFLYPSFEWTVKSLASEIKLGFPIFRDGAGAVVFVNLKTGRVRLHDPEIYTESDCFPNLEAYLSGSVACFKAGIYCLDEEGTMIIRDEDEEAEILSAFR